MKTLALFTLRARKLSAVTDRLERDGKCYAYRLTENGNAAQRHSSVSQRDFRRTAGWRMNGFRVLSGGVVVEHRSDEQ
jgi:hypothetical protein